MTYQGTNERMISYEHSLLLLYERVMMLLLYERVPLSSCRPKREIQQQRHPMRAATAVLLLAFDATHCARWRALFCCFPAFSFFSLKDDSFIMQLLAVYSAAFTAWICLRTASSAITGMRGAAGGRQPAAAKPACIYDIILFSVCKTEYLFR